MSKKVCDFCTESESDDNPIIAGAEAYICSNCVVSAYKILFGDEEIPEIPVEYTENLLFPKEIKSILDDYVIGQNQD